MMKSQPSRALTRAPALLVVAIVAVILAIWPDAPRHPSPRDNPASDRKLSEANGAAMDALIKQGEYLSKAADCVGCHTARVGGKPYAGGFTVSTPLGVIVSTNITPDPDHGIGRYSYEEFARVLRDGVARDGHNLYPAMPYTAFRRMREGDIKGLYAYFMQGVAPVPETPPQTKLPFPFDQRWALSMWRVLFAPGEPFKSPLGATPATDSGAGSASCPRAAEDSAMVRGAYLVQVLGHCGACHTPRGVAYQELAKDETSTDFLVGQVNDDWYAPSLRNTPAAGLGRMSRDDVMAFLKTGHAGGNMAYGAMVDTVQTSTQYLTEEDLHAIATYLKSFPAEQDNAHFHPDKRAQTERRAEEGNRTLDVQSGGAAIYQGFCARCHQPDGAGVADVFPALSGNPSVLAPDSTSLVRIVLQGGASAKTLTGPPPQQMPAFGNTLADVQIAQVLTYVREVWGNDAGQISTNDVADLRATLSNR